ncbi:hypothetical protein CWB96_00015 [Pseudoalteromonas citrea]|uniref:Uncharacterized protein n=1 Tax=Pseudoalteromonas citrea TaxID=43655 RepID=A0A5S3XV47_9GAMM|nr:hypothetical protein [Pseudoalteromonas citrea]TMP46337.1 hypothetical protein CWB97_02445 [Pseudoalteromonas citrea]TMP63028.1 hypothetical protein CWB96_00015 [Pseudoalteromonas citrea]
MNKLENYEFYRVNVHALTTRSAVLHALKLALEELKCSIATCNERDPEQLSHAISFLKRFYERVERITLDDGSLDYNKLIQKQAQSQLLTNAIAAHRRAIEGKNT